MLNLTLSPILDQDKNVTGFLCDQRDDDFVAVITEINSVIPRDAEETRSSLVFQREIFTALLAAAEAQPIYSTHEYLRAGSVETWTVYKASVLNSLIHYCGLRLKTFK